MLGKQILFVFAFFLPFLNNIAWAACPASCPTGWSCYNNTVCSPNLPSSDFFHDAADTNFQRPICGSEIGSGRGRIPVLPNFEPLQISSSSYPKSSNNFTYIGYGTFPSGRSSSDSTYLFENLNRCVCMSTPVAANPSPSPYTDTDKLSGGNYPTGFTRIYPDTYEVISSQNQQASVRYNMVSYGDDSVDPLVDGRDGTLYSSGASSCGCPNINEQPVINSATGTGIVGSHCEPKLTASAGRVLTGYNSSFHAPGAPAQGLLGTQVMDPAEETRGGSIVRKMMIPTGSGGSQIYERKIWTCAAPYVLDQGANKCVAPNMVNHACGPGTDAASASPVSAGITGNTPMDRFNNTVNQKLACCMNDSGKPSEVGAFIKFDCVESYATDYSNFNSLWTSPNAVNDGGHSNAMVLAGPLGKYLTGFYTIDGVRCDQYSEFAAPYQAKRLKRVNGSWTAEAIQGSPVISPPSDFMGKFSGKFVPNTAAEMYRCPILARAAFIATCPPATELPVVLKTYKDPVTNRTHCSAAASIQVHVRVEQIFEIEGQPGMKAVDTIAEQRLASSISVEKIIANKSGNACPGGTYKQGDTCVY